MALVSRATTDVSARNASRNGVGAPWGGGGGETTPYTRADACCNHLTRLFSSDNLRMTGSG